MSSIILENLSLPLMLLCRAESPVKHVLLFLQVNISPDTSFLSLTYYSCLLKIEHLPLPTGPQATEMSASHAVKGCTTVKVMALYTVLNHMLLTVFLHRSLNKSGSSRCAKAHMQHQKEPTPRMYGKGMGSIRASISRFCSSLSQFC